MTEEQKEYEAVKLVNPFFLWIIWTIKISSKPYIYQFVAEIHWELNSLRKDMHELK